MADDCIIPEDHPVGIAIREAASARKMVAVAGIPSTGKSLMQQQLSVLAHQAGRGVHSLQWDVARGKFETGEWLERYPEIDNLTHPGIRKAVGLWARRAVADWVDRHSGDDDILIAELPVIGGRLADLMRPEEDGVEAVLASERALFVVPVPTVEMRGVITGHRARTFAAPRNVEEARDAPMHLVEAEWVATRRMYNAWNGIDDDAARDSEYDPGIYRAVFERLLRHRHLEILSVDRSFEATASAHAKRFPVTELEAGSEAVAAAFASMQERYPGPAAEHAVDGWERF